MTPSYELTRRQTTTEVLELVAADDEEAKLIARALTTGRVDPADGSKWRIETEPDPAPWAELTRIDIDRDTGDVVSERNIPYHQERR